MLVREDSDRPREFVNHWEPTSMPRPAVGPMSVTQSHEAGAAEALPEALPEDFEYENRAGFYRATMETMREGCNTGDCTRRDMRRLTFLRWFVPWKLEELYNRVVREGRELGVIKPQAGAIDWDALKKFLEDVLPMIVAFIREIFSIFRPQMLVLLMALLLSPVACKLPTAMNSASAAEVAWSVTGEHADGPAIVQGVPEGLAETLTCQIDWKIPEPETGTDPRIVKVGQVTCLDGASGSDPFVSIGEVTHDDSSVRFTGSVRSYDRTIGLRVSITCDKRVEQYRLPYTTFLCRDLKLIVSPGAPPPNPPWSAAVGEEYVTPYATTATTVDVNVGEQFTWRHGKLIYVDPMGPGDSTSATIRRLRPWHAHAPTNLYPRVSADPLADGSGIVFGFENLRRFERYAVTLREPLVHVIYLRTM